MHLYINMAVFESRMNLYGNVWSLSRPVVRGRVSNVGEMLAKCLGETPVLMFMFMFMWHCEYQYAIDHSKVSNSTLGRQKEISISTHPLYLQSMVIIIEHIFHKLQMYQHVS